MHALGRSRPHLQATGDDSYQHARGGPVRACQRVLLSALMRHIDQGARTHCVFAAKVVQPGRKGRVALGWVTTGPYLQVMWALFECDAVGSQGADDIVGMGEHLVGLLRQIGGEYAEDAHAVGAPAIENMNGHDTRCTQGRQAA